MEKSILNPFSINYKMKAILPTGLVGTINRGQLEDRQVVIDDDDTI